MKSKRPSFFISLIPVVALVVLQAALITHFGSDALIGPSQLGLICASSIAILLAVLRCGCTYQMLEEALSDSIRQVSVPIVLLLLIGALSGSWMTSGVVPYLINAGLHIISPYVFLPTACLLCGIISLVTGSSWTTVATIGVALIGIGSANGFDSGWTAGAIISGAYFGDKLSPLSDTTILASSSSEVPLFQHINYMLRTTIPSFLISLFIFAVASVVMSTSGESHVDEYIDGLNRSYNLTPWLLVVPIATAWMIYRKLPSLVVMFLGTLLAVIVGLIFQRDAIDSLTPGSIFMDIVQSLVGATDVQSGNESLDALLHTRGMSGMLDTVWLIICAMIFGATMSASRMMETLVAHLLRLIHSAASLVGVTVGTGVVFNAITCDQFLSIVLVSSLYRRKYEQMGYSRRLLSRSVEDGTTVTSVLIPWNSCGMTQSTVLGVSTLTYLPYCFFNILSPFSSVLVAAFFIRKEKNQREAEANETTPPNYPSF